MRGTLRPICGLLPSLTDSWGRSLAQSVLWAGLMVPDEKHLLKVADGRVQSPEIDDHEGEWWMIQLLPYLSNYSFKKGRNAAFVKTQT